MKKSFSKFNLLQKLLRGEQHEYKGFLDYHFNHRKELEIKLPYYDFLRGKIFINDLKDNYEKIPAYFDIAYLIYLLYDEFLDQVKRGAEYRDIAHFLLKGKQDFFETKKREKKVLNVISKNLLRFETVEEDEEDTEQEHLWAYVKIKMDENEILRGEVLLYDLQEYLAGEDLSLEDILAIRYLELISEIKQNGNSTRIQKAIYQRLIS